MRAFWMRFWMSGWPPLAPLPDIQEHIRIIK